MGAYRIKKNNRLLLFNNRRKTTNITNMNKISKLIIVENCQKSNNFD